jgi:DNA-binding XRE family transcriptional regulator
LPFYSFGRPETRLLAHFKTKGEIVMPTLKLKEIRQSKGISVLKLSELTGIHRRTIEDLEKRGDCMLSKAFTLAQALGVTLNDIYTQDETEA